MLGSRRSWISSAAADFACDLESVRLLAYTGLGPLNAVDMQMKDILYPKNKKRRRGIDRRNL